jgi:hypothetical protein
VTEGGAKLAGPRVAALPALALAAGLVLWFAPWLVASEPRMGGDITVEHYPRLVYVQHELRAGRLPLWAPWTLAGVPLLANPQLGLFYPPNWPLYSLLPPATALNYAAALHVALAFAGTYLLARRWGLGRGGALLAATSYGFNGLFVARLWAGNLVIVESAAWLPALLLAADAWRTRPGGRTFGLLTAVLTLSLLVGSYQPWLLGLLATAGYLASMPGALATRLTRLATLAGAVVLALGFAAPQLVPTAELVRWTTRADGLDWEFATAASLPPWHLPTLALPELFGSGAGTYWPDVWWHWHELTAYSGLLPLVLVPLGLRRPRPAWVWYCTGLALVALVLALGRYTPVYAAFYQWVPGYSSFRDPSRHLVLVSLAIALLAGRGADGLLGGTGRRGVLLALAAVVVAGAAGALAATGLAEPLGPAVVPGLEAWGLWSRPAGLLTTTAEAGSQVLLLVARACGVAVVAATAALAAVVLARRAPPPVAALLLPAAVFADLTLFAWPYLRTPLPLAAGVPFGSPVAQFEAFLGVETAARLRAVEEPWRTAPLGRDAVVAGNAGYLLGTALAIGLDPLLPRRYAELAAALTGTPVAAFEHLALYLEPTDSPLWPLLNARYRLVPVGGAYRLEEDPRALPRVVALPRVRTVTSATEGLAAITARDFDPGREAVLEAPSLAAMDRAPADATTPGHATLRHYAPGDVEAEAVLPGGGALLLLEAWHPGWTATVDGQPTAVYPADHAFLGVALPPGRHVVRFRFAPQSLLLGLGIGAATLGGVTLASVALWRRRSGRGEA